MKINFNSRFRESGVALVLTLALLLVATVIVTAFFFRSGFDSQGSDGYSARVSAEQLAELGTSQITALLVKEMEDGSDELVNSNGRILEPTTRESMLPTLQRASSLGNTRTPNDPFNNLVKQTIPTIDNNAIELHVSDIRTDTEPNGALEGRPLDERFWDKPLLTHEEFPASALPNWVYVTARGETLGGGSASGDQKPGSPDRVVGRYAANVYDVGGLLDINAAGYDSGADLFAGRKGNLIFADLPGLGTEIGVATDLSTAIADINNWRYNSGLTWSDSDPNSSGYVPSEKLQAFLSSGPMLASLGSFPPGFDPTITRVNQNAFLSRADTIRFFEQYLGSREDVEKLMPYITHYTRDINAPTFTWDWDKGRPKPQANGNSVKAGEIEEINASSWDESNGKIQLARRFPLERLNLLEMDSNGEPVHNSAEDKELIRRYFGLRWEGGNFKRWVYEPYHESARGPSYIRSLSEIDPDQLSQPGMEPNFFEVLAAAINAGSLGQQMGGVVDKMVSQSGSYSGPNRPHAWNEDDASVQQHIMRIGAAIIDQWDRDSFPTQLEFDGRVLFGVEDLPYLHGFKRASYIGDGSKFTAKLKFSSTHPDTHEVAGNEITVTECAFLVHPQVWNPHSSLSGRSPNNLRPTKFRVVPYTDMLKSVKSGRGNPFTEKTPAVSYGTDFGRRPRMKSLGYDHASANGSLDYETPFQDDDPNAIGQFTGLPAEYRNLSSAKHNPPLDQKKDWMEFEDVVNAANSKFRQPVLLWKPSGNGAQGNVDVTLSGRPDSTTVEPFGFQKGGLFTGSAATGQAVGFRLGKFLGMVPNTPFPNDEWYGFSQVDLTRHGVFTDTQVRTNFALQYQVGGQWITYDIMYDVFDFFTEGLHEHIWRVIGRDFDATYRSDPRVERFGPQTTPYRVHAPAQANQIAKFPANKTGWEPSNQRWTFRQTLTDAEWPGDIKPNGYNIGPWSQGGALRTHLHKFWKYDVNTSAPAAMNTKTFAFTSLARNRGLSGGVNTGNVYYLDPDLELRPASGGWPETPTATDGVPVVWRNAQANTPQEEASRPVILNRPFQSVVEMAYACRDLPWKNIDFWNANSGDSALLDYFCMYEVDDDPEGPQLTAGVVNINSASPEVLASLISAASVQEDPDTHDTASLTYAQALDIAKEYINWMNTEGLLQSRADIVGRWDPAKKAYIGPFTQPSATTPGAGPLGDKLASISASGAGATGNILTYDQRRANLLRALVDTSTVRTWNLMIDIVAQSGKLPPNSDSLSDFIVDGQTRSWVFLSIDRFTGKIVDQRIESAN